MTPSNTLRVAVTLLSVLLCAAHPARAQQEADDVDADARPSWEGSPSLVIDLHGAYDSNVLNVSSGVPGAGGSAELAAGFFASYSLNRSSSVAPESKLRRFVTIDFGADVEGLSREDRKDLEPLYRNNRVSIDFDFMVCKECYLHPTRRNPKFRRLKRASFGVLLETRSTELDHEPFQESVRLTSALQFAWRNREDCELSPLLVYHRLDRHDDRETPNDPVFDRSGTYRAFGFEQTLHVGTLHQGCERRGPFRQFIPESSPTVSFGYEYEDRDTDGTEFDGELNRLFARGHRLLHCSFTRGPAYDPDAWSCHQADAEPKWLVDGLAEISRSNYSRNSAFAPNLERRDAGTYVEVVFRRNLRKWLGKNTRMEPLARYFHFRTGVAYSIVDSTIPIYDYTRSYWFIGFEAGLGDARAGTIPRAAGARTPRDSGGSGSDSAVVVDEIRDQQMDVSQRPDP